MRRKSALNKRSCSCFAVVLLLLISLLSLNVFQTEASSATVEADNPILLFELPDEMKVTFQICSSNEFSSPSEIDFQLGETVYLRLSAEFYHGGELPTIANNTIFVVSDTIGSVVWNVSVCEFGGGWIQSALGGTQAVVRWTPENAGNYTAGVVFEGTNYPNYFSKIMSFRVLQPSPSNDDSAEPDANMTQGFPESATSDDPSSNLPLTANISSAAMIVMVCLALLVYFKKCKR
jgi:hypothetical protein